MKPQIKRSQAPESDAIGLDKDTLTFIEMSINAFIKYGGALAGEEQYLERVSACRSCPYFGEVTIPLLLKKLTLEGCTLCGCPVSTKPRARKYFSFTELRIIKATCPNPEGSLWESIDKKYA